MKVIIQRTEFYPTQTLGTLSIIEGKEVVFSCKTIELEEDVNAVKDDCIPRGKYQVVKRNSPKYGNHFHILNVPNRDFILIHAANYSRQLLGCVAVGKAHVDIDKDGLKDVTSSKQTMAELNDILPDTFELEIV